MPATLLERPPPAVRPGPTPPGPAAAAGGARRPPRAPGGAGGGGGGRRRRDQQCSIWLAALITALIGALFTFLGILTQIWANMAGSQLPGA